MSNKDLIRRVFDEVVNKGDVDAADELFDPDFTSVTPEGTLDREAFKQYVLQWRGGFPDLHCEVSDLVEEGDRIAWTVRAVGTHTGDFMGIPATGRATDFLSMNIAEVRNGRGHHHRVLMDTMTLMTQLGLVPEQA